jgi:Fe-S-cluster containining protein
MPYYQRAKLRFECTGCGACCTGGRDHYVEASAREREAIRRFLGLSVRWFRQRYLTRVDDDVTGIRLGADGRCPFLGQDNRCRVYPVRPRQCRTYPWWPELVERAADWREEARRCEGMNRGAVVSLATIERALAWELKGKD